VLRNTTTETNDWGIRLPQDWDGNNRIDCADASQNDEDIFETNFLSDNATYDWS
jgi:hypothetical protein